MYDRDTRGGATWHALSHAHASSSALPQRLSSPHETRARIQHGWDPQHAHLRASWRSQQPQQCIRTSVHPRQLKARRQTTPSAPVTPRARSASHWSDRTIGGGSCAALRRNRHQVLHGLTKARRQLLVVLCAAFNRRLRVDLERSTPKSSIPSPIMTVTSTPPWRDHLALIVTARTPPASGCTDARQWVEQKRSTVQRRSALSTALRSAIACAMSAGVANAGAEGALIAIRPSFPARN